MAIRNFKYPHSLETQLKQNQLKLDQGGIKFERPIYLNFLIYDKSFFEKIDTRWIQLGNIEFKTSQWLYCYLDENANLQFGLTSSNPHEFGFFGFSFPENPIAGTLFFNRSVNRMFMWNGKGWLEKDAIVIAEFAEDGNCQELYHRYSQSGYNTNRFNCSAVYKNSNLDVIKIFHNGSYTFLSEEEFEKLKFSKIKHLIVGNTLVKSIASQDIDSLTVINRGTDDVVHPVSLNSSMPATGLVLEDVSEGEDALIIEEGFFYDRTINRWPANPNTPIYYDNNGKLTVDPPDLFSYSSAQRVGHVVNNNTIFFKPEKLFLLDKGL